MSEFKFNCPVCGKAIKCESWRHNTMMECPSCFQRIIIPKASADDDVELVITGSKVTRRIATGPVEDLGQPAPPPSPRKCFPLLGIAFVVVLCVVVAAVFVFKGKVFQSSDNQTRTTRPINTQTNLAKPPSASSAAPVVTHAPKMLKLPIRIKAGLFTPFMDSKGNTWLPDQSFVGGDTIDRPNLQIANTESPEIYRSERYNMTAFSCLVPNGKYTVKLHFAECYEGVTKAGQRVFSFNVEGHEFTNFDIWLKAGGPRRAYVETVSVEVTDGKLDVTFTPKVQNPEINGIEIIPETAASAAVELPADGKNGN